MWSTEHVRALFRPLHIISFSRNSFKCGRNPLIIVLPRSLEGTSGHNAQESPFTLFIHTFSLCTKPKKRVTSPSLQKLNFPKITDIRNFECLSLLFNCFYCCICQGVIYFWWQEDPLSQFRGFIVRKFTRF